MKIGMLYSLSGAQEEMEKSILDGAVVAVHEINASGGVLGEELSFAVFDDRSEVASTARGIDRLCRDESVDVIVGGYTSASRVSMRPAIHANRSLLMYPTYFEGEETDSRVFYCGAAPNQYLADYLGWIASTLGRRVYIVGSDYIYPRVLGEAIRRLGAHWDVETVGDWYAPLGETSFAAVLDDIGRKRPSVIICNLVGRDSTTAFYTQFHRAGFTSDSLPIAATATTAIDLGHIPPEVSDGHFMVATYFSRIESDVNASYRQSLIDICGQRRTHAAQVGAYNAVHALRLAAEQSRSLDPVDLSEALLCVRFDGSPEGLPFYFRSDHYSAHPSYVGRAADGDYDVIEEFPPRLPEPWWSGSIPLSASS
ncbi:transporter substrate-binding protein [Rhodococcus wratislaviensis]|uniref:transporter substrate-binding protein n=1 Tax=Rhodococcus sp. A14 TaxID=1194106 RepID=UPI0022F30DF2|nr:transporter substrate-binding protein [Rhodococcus wratislaviensis]GLK33930.1 urea ABC transporter substrate-binding protein [Rhodococcus wratislaviensis]